MIVSRSCKSHIQWRIENLEVRFKLISHGKHTLTAPRQVGAYDKTKKIHTGGHWSKEEQEDHNNVLELRAIFLGLKV